ncbi:hypothetical protein [Streptomyces venezuelae]|uniref:hypothetical protein n=1 Tax=Streptomyces venezuelae TaxID=54571 RepID=UPI003326C1B0
MHLSDAATQSLLAGAADGGYPGQVVHDVGAFVRGEVVDDGAQVIGAGWSVRQSQPIAAAGCCSAPSAPRPGSRRGDADFLGRLRDAGLRVRERHGDDGALVGYAVALLGDRADRGSRPVWFSGSTLAYDLSLPRERFEPAVTPADRALAEHRIREASALLGCAGQAEGAGDVAALGDLLADAAEPCPGSGP